MIGLEVNIFPTVDNETKIENVYVGWFNEQILSAFGFYLWLSEGWEKDNRRKEAWLCCNCCKILKTKEILICENIAWLLLKISD